MIGEIDALMQEMVQADGPGAAVGVMQGGEIIHMGGYGLANVEWSAPITEQTVFRLASISKPLTACAVMVLAERGDLDLHAPITDYLPDYPTSGHQLTAYHLLTHTAGISNERGPGDLKDRYDINPHTMLAYFSQRPFYFKPGTAYRYANTTYVLLGLLIEAVSGQPYAAFMQSHVFAPLNMETACFFHHRAIIPQRATGYTRHKGQLRHPRVFSADISYAGGGLGGSIRDMMAWVRGLRDNTLISAEGWAQMCTPAMLEDGSSTYYGLGWALRAYHGHTLAGHSGTTPGFSNQIVLFTEDDLAICVLSNNARFDSDRAAAAIARHLFDIETPKRRPYIVGAGALAKCIGAYAVADKTIHFLRDENNLILRTSQDRRLLAVGRNTFFSPDNPDVSVAFSDEVDGVYTTITMQTSFSTYVAKRVQDPSA